MFKHEVLVQKAKPLLFSRLKAPNLKFTFCNYEKLGVCMSLLVLIHEF